MGRVQRIVPRGRMEVNERRILSAMPAELHPTNGGRRASTARQEDIS